VWARGRAAGARAGRALSSVVLRPLLVSLVVAGLGLGAAARAAQADGGGGGGGGGTVDDALRILDQAGAHLEEARRLRDVLAIARELAYADPRAVEWAFASAYGEVLADPIVGPLIANLAAQYRGGYVRVDLDAGVGGDLLTPAAGSVAVGAAWELPICRVLGARAAGLGGWEDGGAVGSYVLTGSACLPLPADTIEFAYTRRGNVRTSLLTVPVVLDERRSGDVYDFDIRFYRYRGEHNQVDVMPFQVHIDVSRDEAGGFGAITSRVVGAPAAWKRRGKGLAGEDQVWRFMGFDMRYQDDDAAIGGRDAGVVTILPLEISGVPVTPEVAASVGGGYVRAGGVDGEVDVVEASGAVAYPQLGALPRPVRLQARAARDYLPTYDAQFVVDDRLSTRVDVAVSRAVAGVAIFAARDQVMRDTDTPAAELVTGGSVDGAYALGGGLHVLARVEGAHAIEAGRAADAVTTRFDVRASAGLSYHWDQRWPKLSGRAE